MNHKLPGIAELIQTNMQIYREQPLSLLPSKGTVPIAFAPLSSGWHACTLASTDADIFADESKPPAAWEQVGVLTVAAPLPAAIQLLGTHSYVLVTDDQGEPVGYLDRPTVLRAVFTSYEILEAYFETMIQTMDASISVIDEKARVMVWTEGAERIFSLKAKDIVGRPITDFFPLDMLETLKSLHNGQSLYRHQHQPREDLVVLINTKPIYLHDTIIGAVAAETDITSQVRLNQELLKANKKVNHLQQEMAKLSSTPDPFQHIKGTSLAIRQIKSMIQKLGSTQATVLIIGESGVGKELFAKAVHDVREGANAPFIAINCGAISPTLFESELFGYEKGAFSGADQKGKKGMIELARGGTLFLDEVGEMPLDMQVKLLRVLQEKKYYPVGGTKQIEADFRIVAATNKNLEEMIREGKFREDLYYRLNVVTLAIPPLRQRIEDTVELAHFFSTSFPCATIGRSTPSRKTSCKICCNTTGRAIFANCAMPSSGWSFLLRTERSARKTCRTLCKARPSSCPSSCRTTCFLCRKNWKRMNGASSCARSSWKTATSRPLPKDSAFPARLCTTS